MGDLLRETGEALFGSRWQSDIARALQITDRTVRRWAAEDGAMPPGVALDLWRLCEKRMLALEVVRDRLKPKA